MKTKLSFVLFFIAFIGMSSLSFAQQSAPSAGDGDAAALSPGILGLGFDVNENRGGSVGMKYFFTGNLAGTIDFGLRLERGQFADDGSDWAIELSPGLQYFFKMGHKVSPFLFGAVNIVAADGPFEARKSVSFSFGGGAEYFVYDYFSIAGAVGLNLLIIEDFGFGTGTGSVGVNFYF